MYIPVENLLELLERHPELQDIRDITANHGTESEISKLCEVIAKLYAKLDTITQISTLPVPKKSRE